MRTEQHISSAWTCSKLWLNPDSTPPVLSCLSRYHAVNAVVGQQMYRDMVQPVVERFCQGYNGCILAYGQTGQHALTAVTLKHPDCQHHLRAAAGPQKHCVPYSICAEMAILQHVYVSLIK